MSTVVLLVRLALAGVFALAGIAKLANLAGSREAVQSFGVPLRLARTVGSLVPICEIAVATALLPTPSARWGAIGAAILLAGFSGGVAHALHQGLTPDCNCFGQVASAPVSSRTLVRNGVLGALAVFAAVAGPGAGLSSWTTDRSAANIVAALAAVTAGVLATVVYARRGASIATVGPPASGAGQGALAEGAPAPDFELHRLDGERVSLRQLLSRGRPVVLIFASPTCPPCLTLLPHLARWNTVIGNDVTLVVVESSWRDGVLPGEQRAALGGLITVTEPGRRIAESYRAPATPCAIAVTPDGRIASQPMPGSNQVERLIRQVLEGRTAPSAPARGEPLGAPA